MKKAYFLPLLLLAGCASDGIEPLQPLEIPTAPYSGTVSASVTGSLMYEGGCLLFRDDDNRLQLLPIWPDRTTFDGTSVIFHERGRSDQRVLISEEILLQGRPLEWSEIPGPRTALHHQKCNRRPFLVLGVRPAN